MRIRTGTAQYLTRYNAPTVIQPAILALAQWGTQSPGFPYQ